MFPSFSQLLLDSLKTGCYHEKRSIVKWLSFEEGGDSLNNREVTGRLMLLHLLRGKRLRERTSGGGLYDGQLPILEFLIHSPGCTQCQIAHWLCVSPASIAQSTKRLQKAGLIEKRVDADNLRCNRLYATESGIATAQEYRKTFDVLDDETLHGFSEEDMRLAVDLLDRMIANVNREHLPFNAPWKEN